MRLRETLRDEGSLTKQSYVKDPIKGIAVLNNLKRAITKLRKRRQKSRSKETIQDGGRKILSMVIGS